MMRKMLESLSTRRDEQIKAGNKEPLYAFLERFSDEKDESPARVILTEIGEDYIVVDIYLFMTCSWNTGNYIDRKDIQSFQPIDW